jgi:flagellar hook-length control protein FliK
MAQIDLLNLPKATSAPSPAGAGPNSSAKSTVAAGLFEQILSGQAGETASVVPGGNVLPINAMSKLQQAQSSQQLLATLSPQQHSQIDDLSFITQLQPMVDMPQTPVAAAVSQFADSKVNFSDQQLQDLAIQLGIDPAVASLVLQNTVKPETVVGSLNTQAVLTSAAHSSNTNIGMGFKPGQAQVVEAVDVVVQAQKVDMPIQPQVQGQPQVQAQIQPQVQVQPQAVPSVQTQASTTHSLDLPLNDADVIKVRSQPSSPATNTSGATQATASTSNVTSSGTMPSALAPTPQVATQSFLQQRQARIVNQVPDKKVELANTINKVLTQAKVKATSVAGSNTATTYASITLAPSLVQKLDQATGVGSLATNATNSLEPQALGSYTGANFKAAAPLANAPTASALDVSTMDVGQRFTSLMQGDSSAQLAARQMQDQLGQQLQRMVKEGRWQANLSLHPARLGQVNINLVMEDGVLQTQLLSANAGVRELLESSLPRLREQLEGSGLQLAGVSVGSDSRGQQHTRGEAPDWQLSQTVKNTNEERIPVATAGNRSDHDGDIDTFA